MNINLKGSAIALPIMDFRGLQKQVTSGVVDGMINVYDELSEVGFNSFAGNRFMDVIVLNDILSEYLDLTDSQFEEFCAIIEIKFNGDLARHEEAVDILLSGAYDYVKLGDAEKELSGYAKTQKGFIRMAGEAEWTE